LVLTLYLNNEADDSVSTSTSSWKLIVDGLKYWPNDEATFLPYIEYQDVYVEKGEEIEVQMVYLVKGDPDQNEGSLEYTGVTVPMKRIDYY